MKEKFTKVPVMLAAVVLSASALHSCSKEEVKPSGHGREISLGVSVDTRATEITSESYFDFGLFVKLDGNVYSNPQTVRIGSDRICTPEIPLYWPMNENDDSLDFYAYGPVEEADQIKLVSDEGAGEFLYTPERRSERQVDFVYAHAKSAETGTVVLPFSHMTSEIALRAYSDSFEKMFAVVGWGIRNAAASGICSFSMDGSCIWQPSTEVSEFYCDNLDGKNKLEDSILPKDQEYVVFERPFASMLGDSMMMVPQKREWDLDWDKGDEAPMIFIDMVVVYLKNQEMKFIPTLEEMSAGKYWITCCWPIPFDWEPGKRYEYSINLADGGYVYNKDGSNKWEPLFPDD